MRKSRNIDPMLERVCKILWEDWDPIGVNDEPGAFGEYDSYAAGVLARVLAGDSASELDEHLATIETVSMGLRGGRPGCRERAVRKLLALRSEAPR